MKMYLISDNVDTYTGMRLAGVDGVVVHEKQELRTSDRGDPRPSRYRPETGFYHLLCQRSHWTKTVTINQRG